MHVSCLVSLTGSKTQQNNVVRDDQMVLGSLLLVTTLGTFTISKPVQLLTIFPAKSCPLEPFSIRLSFLGETVVGLWSAGE